MTDRAAKPARPAKPAQPAKAGGRAPAPPSSTSRPSTAPRAHSLQDLGALKATLAAQRQAEAEARQRTAEAQAAERREREAFARAVGPVTALRQPPRAAPSRPLPPPEPLQRRLDEEAVLREALSDEFNPASLMETDEALTWSRPGIGPDVLRRLRRGDWVVQGQIDLHGLTRDAAREALGDFLRRAGKQGWRCVRVVHGKGIGSPGRLPVLKGKVRNWLVQNASVLAFAQAQGHEGGAGALIVLLNAQGQLQR